jgi:hypothetical protein
VFSLRAVTLLIGQKRSTDRSDKDLVSPALLGRARVCATYVHMYVRASSQRHSGLQ